MEKKEIFLQEDWIIKDCKKEINKFFLKKDLNKDTDLKTVWDTSKVVIKSNLECIQIVQFYKLQEKTRN